MRYLVRVGELKEKIDYYKKLMEDVKTNVRYLESIKQNLIWDGPAHAAFITYYDKHIEEMKKIIIGIAVLINFLSSFCDNYGYEYLRLRNKYDTMTDWRNETWQ